MTRHWIRRPARWKETFGAGLLAAGVAAATFYLVRLTLARDLLPEPSRDRRPEPPEEPAEAGGRA